LRMKSTVEDEEYDHEVQHEVDHERPIESPGLLHGLPPPKPRPLRTFWYKARRWASSGSSMSTKSLTRSMPSRTECSTGGRPMDRSIFHQPQRRFSTSSRVLYPPAEESLRQQGFSVSARPPSLGDSSSAHGGLRWSTQGRWSVSANGQRIYFEAAQPWGRATFVVDDSDFTSPGII
jgi:hypothetical protein